MDTVRTQHNITLLILMNVNGMLPELSGFLKYQSKNHNTQMGRYLGT